MSKLITLHKDLAVAVQTLSVLFFLLSLRLSFVRFKKKQAQPRTSSVSMTK